MNNDIDGDEAMKKLDDLTDKLFRPKDDEPDDTEDISEEEPEGDE